MRRSTWMLTAGAAVLGVALAACGGSTTSERAAAAEESAMPSAAAPSAPASEAAAPSAPASEAAAPSAPASEAAAPSAPASEAAAPSEEPATGGEGTSPSEKLGLRVAANDPNPNRGTGSKLCVQNNSSSTVDLGGRGTVSPGGQQCVDGASLMGADISFTISVNGVAATKVEANNPFIGIGWVKLSQDAYGQCLYEGLASKNAKSSPREDGLLRYQFKRLTPLDTSGEGGQIEYQLSLSDPGKRSQDGQPLQCS